LTDQDFLQGRDVLREKIKHYQPAIVAVLGMSVAQVLLAPEKTRSSGNQVAKDRIQTGLQPITLAGVRVYVLPNPSGRNAHYSYQAMKDLFVELLDVSRKLPQVGES
jgi:TDG/mug DNA glycosylase family protein